MGSKKGKVIVISAPSGTGKSTVCRLLLKKIKNLKYSVSVTTRQKRKFEKDGKDYFFVTKDEFKKMVKNNYFIEWQKVHNNYYGTPKEFIEKNLNKGYNVLLDIDVKGGKTLKKIYPDGIFIFLVPPSWEELKRRLKSRGTEDEKELELRLKNAKKELKFKKYYDFVIVNDKIEETLKKIVEIIKENL
jgi:guanylate kinase